MSLKYKKTLSLANLLSLSNPALAKSLSKSEYYYISYLSDPALDEQRHIRSEIGAVSYILALIAAFVFKDKEPFKAYDIGHLSGESNLGEEEALELAKWLFNGDDKAQIIIDSSFYTHPDRDFIFAILDSLNLEIIVADEENKGKDILIKKINLAEPKELDSFDGSVVYAYKSDEEGVLRANESWCAVAKVNEGDKIKLSFKDGSSVLARLVKDTSLKGTVGLLPLKEIKGYNFKLAKVEKV